MKHALFRTRLDRRAALSALAGFAAELALPGPLAAQAALQKVRVITRVAEPITPLDYAITSGLFARLGLDVAITPSINGSASTAALLAGDFDFAQSNLLPLFTAHLRGVPFVVVAPASMYAVQYPGGQLQIAPDSTIKSGADLNGKTVGVEGLNDIDALGVRVWVDKNGGDSRTVKFVEIPMASDGAALVEHRIDAAVIGPPMLGASLAAGTSKTLADPLGAIAGEFLVSGYIARPDWASEHLDLVRAFSRGITMAAAYVNAHFEETRPLVAELTKLPLSEVATMHRTRNATQLDATLIQPCIDVAAKYGAIARPFSAREIILGG